MLSHLIGNFPDIDIYWTIEYTSTASNTAHLTAVPFWKIAQLMHKSLSQSFLFARSWVMT
jgi:hypothetical protein